ncbi:MAG: rane protein [Proteobacteria bacterium]|nr:rane protein [Pseudomonadota bacterium]
MRLTESARNPKLISLVGFVIRCAASASIACWLSDAIGLSHTVWASMSALIVSQEKLEATRAQVVGRIAGTLIGALIALAVHRAGIATGLSTLVQLTIAVSLCAIIARGRPTLRVCLWTCPLVLLTGSADQLPELTALSRSIEVLLGALVGGFLHHVEIAVIRSLGLETAPATANPPSDDNSGGGD